MCQKLFVCVRSEKLQLEKLFTPRSTRWSEMLSKTQWCVTWQKWQKTNNQTDQLNPKLYTYTIMMSAHLSWHNLCIAKVNKLYWKSTDTEHKPWVNKAILKFWAREKNSTFYSLLYVKRPWFWHMSFAGCQPPLFLPYYLSKLANRQSYIIQIRAVHHWAKQWKIRSSLAWSKTEPCGLSVVLSRRFSTVLPGVSDLLWNTISLIVMLFTNLSYLLKKKNELDLYYSFYI